MDGNIPDGSAMEQGTDLFRLLVASVKDYSIFYLDPQGYIRSWNEGAQRTKGYAAEEIIGKHFSIFYPPQEARRGKPAYGLRVAAEEGRWEEEGWRVRKDGSRFWADVVITALYDAEGVLVGFGKVTRDLSERKRADDERRQLLELERLARMEAEAALERLQAIQQVIEVAFAYLSLDELLPALLERISAILFVDAGAVALRSDEKPDWLTTRAVVGSALEETLGRGVAAGQGFVGQIAGAGQPRRIEDLAALSLADPLLQDTALRSVMGVPLLVQGRVVGVLYVGMLRYWRFSEADIQYLTIMADRMALAIEHTLLEEAARQARVQAEVAEATLHTQNEFLSIAAHELNTPVTTIKAMAQMLLRRYKQQGALDLAQIQRGLRAIDRQSDRIARLVQHLLETTRLQAEKITLRREWTNITELVQELVEQTQLITEEEQLVLSAPEPIWGFVDRMRLEQVVTNLLDNARKFSPPGSQIDVGVEAPTDEQVLITVRDRGPGVAPEHQARLFERFYQATVANHPSGLGLGLYISRELITLHGGTIEASFPSDGGTCFVVTLPRAGDGAPPRTPAPD
jgi:PAS domain S-box-containing protein